MGRRIDLKVGYRCNNHCRFCVQGDKRERLPDRTDEEILFLLEERRSDNEDVVFTGGEATIRKGLFSWINCARELGYREIQIQSNGRMFAYEAFCEQAIRAGANCFALALHGSGKEIHDRLTLAPGSFEQTVKGIKNLKKLGQRVLLNTVVNKINYTDLPSLAGLFAALKIEQYQFAFIHINQLIRNDPGLIEEIVPRKSETMGYIKKGLQIGIDHHARVMAEAVPYCFMEGYEEYVAERFIPPTSVEDVFYIPDFAKTRKEEGKAKGPLCAECAYDDICEGPWREYPEIFGWEEFKPVKTCRTKNGN